MMDTAIDDDDIRDSLLANDLGGGVGGEGMDQERRIRREIANSNERRRMQSINSGFQSLRTLLPHHEGEKLSKAAILQQTAEYIYTLEQEKTLLLSQNSQLKRLLSLNQQRVEQLPEGLAVDSTSPQLKKKRPNLLNEGTTIVGNTILDDNGTLQEEQTSTTTGTVSNMNLQLMEEQRLRLRLEERVKSLERQLSMSSQQLRPPSNINPEPPSIVSTREPEQTITILTTGGGNEKLATTNAEQILSRSNPLPPNPATARLPTAPQPPPTAILLQAAAAASAATSSTIPVTIPTAKVNPSPAASQITVSMSGPPNSHTIKLSNEKNMVAVPAAVLQAAMAASKKDIELSTQVPSLKRVEMERLPTFQPSLPPPTLPSVPLPRQSPQNQPQQALGSRGTTIIKLDTTGNELRDGKPAVAGSSITISGERRFTPEVCIVPSVQSVPVVSRVPSLPNVPISVCTSASQSSRQNLDSIVEAIRHLEGDHLFSEDHQHNQVVKEEVVDYSTTSVAASIRPVGEKTSTSSTNSLIVPISSVSKLSSSSALPTSATTVVPVSINSQLSQAGVAIAALPTLPIPPPPTISASSNNIVTVQKSISVETIQLPQQPCSVSITTASMPATISAVASNNQYTQHHQHPSRPEGGTGSIIILKQP